MADRKLGDVATRMLFENDRVRSGRWTSRRASPPTCTSTRSTTSSSSSRATRSPASSSPTRTVRIPRGPSRATSRRATRSSSRSGGVETAKNTGHEAVPRDPRRAQGVSGPAPAPDDRGPLTGLRVLDVATLFAAPQVATMLGDLGADVVKVETSARRPVCGEWATAAPGAPRPGSWWVANKRSIALDLDTDGPDRATFRALVAASDVLVENLTPALRERRACTYDALHAVNPRIVVVSVSCYGGAGPYASSAPEPGPSPRPIAGLTHMTGEADGPPMLPSVAIGDTLTAFAGVMGALAACWARDVRGGDGRLVDVEHVRAGARDHGEHDRRLGSVGAAARRGAAVGSRGGAPRNVYRTATTRYVAVSGTTDAQVARVLAVSVHDSDCRSRALRSRGRPRSRSPTSSTSSSATWIAAHRSRRGRRLAARGTGPRHAGQRRAPICSTTRTRGSREPDDGRRRRTARRAGAAAVDVGPRGDRRAAAPALDADRERSSRSGSSPEAPSPGGWRCAAAGRRCR